VGLDRSWIVYALRGLSYLRPRFRDRTWVAIAETVRPVVDLANLIGESASGLRVEALDAGNRVLGGSGEEAKRYKLGCLPSTRPAGVRPRTGASFMCT
jgi:hypothetical protein